MATTNTAALVGGTGGSNLLPRSVSSNIWKAALDATIVPALSSSTPMILGDNTFPTLTKRPSASIVGEGANKPQSDLEVGSKTVRPIKAVVGLEFTLEAILANPAGVLGLMESELSAALARQIDLAVLHGKDATSGSTISGVEFLNQTTNRVELGTNADADLWEGYGAVVNAGHDFTGFAVDPRLVFALATARDAQGRRLNPEINMGSSVTSYAGQPVAVSKTVSGQVDGQADTGVRAFGGDFNALKFGHVLDIKTKKIEYGDPFGNGDLQRRNAVAYLSEIIFGWAVMDLDAFAAYDVADEDPVDPEA